MKPLTHAQADAIWDVLVEHAGADGTEPEGRYSARTHFVFAQTDRHVEEYRFGGALGPGGKFWRYAGAWYVTAYPEDIQARPERQQIIDDTNRVLAALNKQEVRDGA